MRPLRPQLVRDTQRRACGTVQAAAFDAELFLGLGDGLERREGMLGTDEKRSEKSNELIHA
jgi:hypothetical protein